MADDPWDIDPNRPTENPQGELARRVTTAANAQRARVQSDRNVTVPQPEYDPVTKRQLYETAPVPLPRLFGSPLAMSGKYAQPPNGERLVSSGWGAPRSTGYNEHVNTAARHQALDFTAPFGEPVYASGDGVVRFVGFQSKHGGVFIDGIHCDDAKEEMYNAKGEIVASTAINNIGFGGMFVSIRHNGDFQGYQTEYFHLSNTHVNEGDCVVEGQIIGNIGGTGGYYNWFHKGTHLHYQVAFTAGNLHVLVRPTSLVPNRWPGHTDSTNSGIAADILLPLVASVGGQVAAGQAARVLSAFNRATDMQNKSGQDLKNDQADHADRTARTLDVKASAVYAADAAFKGEAPKVISPMTFDFDKGVWVIGDVENGVV